MEAGRPHWESNFPEDVWPAFEEFRTFLCLVWSYIGLPEPTQAQLEIAHRLQYGADSIEWSDLTNDQQQDRIESVREDIVRCFRGIGKSYVTAAFALWLLLRNPRDEKVLVISATGSKAKKFVSQVKGVGMTMDLTRWLFEGNREKGTKRRDEADQFDVTAASLSQDFSVVARGITGQITGNRATTVIADDIEIEQNSRTEDARQRILDITREFDAIAKTEHGKGDQFFLGTPQTEESVYNVLVRERGFACFTIPVRFPAAAKLKEYDLEGPDGLRKSIIAPYLLAAFKANELSYGQITDPQRFDEAELLTQESKGRAYFALQYMLDTSLSDAERYPLRTSDLIVMSLNHVKAPITVQWGRDSDRRNLVSDIKNMGFSGDHFLRPLFLDETWTHYEGVVCFVDPAGRGKDEVAWAIMASLHGMLFLLHVGAHRGDPALAMKMICQDAKRFSVNVIDVEPNMGGGMFRVALEPILSAVWPGGCTLQDSEWQSTMKEARIIDTLEPVMTQHRLIVSEEVVRADVEGACRVEAEKSYSLIYQLTHIAKERGSLKHDDRLDAVAGAVAYWIRTMAVSADQAAKSHKDDLMMAVIERFVEDQSTPMGLTRGKLRGRRPGEEVMRTKIPF